MFIYHVLHTKHHTLLKMYIYIYVYTYVFNTAYHIRMPVFVLSSGPKCRGFFARALALVVLALCDPEKRAVQGI